MFLDVAPMGVYGPTILIAGIAIAIIVALIILIVFVVRNKRRNK